MVLSSTGGYSTIVACSDFTRIVQSQVLGYSVAISAAIMMSPFASPFELTAEYERVLQTAKPPRVKVEKRSNGEDSTTNRANQSSDVEDRPSICQVKKLIEYPQSRYSSETHVAVEEGYRRRRRMNGLNRPFQEFAIILRKYLDSDHRLVSIDLEIQSAKLCDLLQRLGRSVRGLVNLDAYPMIFQKPFRSLMFVKDELIGFLETGSGETGLKDEVSLLLEFINSSDGIQSSVRAYDEQIRNGKVSFALLWALFPPETTVYFNDDTSEYCGVVQTANYIGQNFRITVVVGHHSGVEFGLIARSYMIQSFPGLYEINTKNIAVVPLSSFPDWHVGNIRQRLIARGKRYCHFQSEKMTHLAYKGPMWTISSSLTENGRNRAGNRVEVCCSP